MVLTEVEKILERLREVITQAAPDVRLVEKYGGEVLCPDPCDEKHFIGGIFGYAAHATMEFSKGAHFEDPDGRLQGGGKARRHLKFKRVADVDTPVVRGFLGQALDL